jgi:hypothetical protein
MNQLLRRDKQGFSGTTGHGSAPRGGFHFVANPAQFAAEPLLRLALR